MEKSTKIVSKKNNKLIALFKTEKENSDNSETNSLMNIDSADQNSLDLNMENSHEDKDDENNERKSSKWTDVIDNKLRDLVEEYGTKNWKFIASQLKNKTAVQCLHRWNKILKPGLVKGPWTIEEDRKLLEWIKINGPTKWTYCSEFISGRSGKQCRERWFNTLNPNVKKGGWTPEEDFLIFKFFSEFGSKWSLIASKFPGRTENSVKNRFYSTLRRISLDKKKILSNEKKNLEQESNASSCNYNPSSNLEELMKYLPQAFAEKTKIFLQYKKCEGDVSDNMELLENLKKIKKMNVNNVNLKLEKEKKEEDKPSETSNLDYENKDLNEYLHKKRFRDNNNKEIEDVKINLKENKSLNSQINNTFNFNFNITNGNFEDVLKTKNKDSKKNSKSGSVKNKADNVGNKSKNNIDDKEQRINNLGENSNIRRKNFEKYQEKKRKISLNNNEIEQKEKKGRKNNEKKKKNDENTSKRRVLFEENNEKADNLIEKANLTMCNTNLELNEYNMIDKELDNLKLPDIQNNPILPNLNLDLLNTNMQKIKENQLQNMVYLGNDTKDNSTNQKEEIFKFDALNDLYNQLNNLENILLNTKKQLFTLDKYFFKENPQDLNNIVNQNEAFNLNSLENNEINNISYEVDKNIMLNSNKTKSETKIESNTTINSLNSTVNKLDVKGNDTNTNFENNLDVTTKNLNMISARDNKNMNVEKENLFNINNEYKNNSIFQDDLLDGNFIKFQNSSKNSNLFVKSSSNIFNGNMLFNNFEGQINEDQSFQFLDNVFQI